MKNNFYIWLLPLVLFAAQSCKKLNDSKGQQTKPDTSKTDTSTAITGYDLYINGYVGDYPIKPVAWRNNVQTDLPAPVLTDNYSTKKAIAVGKDVYVAGTSNYGACYWKNGKLIKVGDGKTYTEPQDIFVKGNDVYMCGFQNVTSPKGYTERIAVYWKNGVRYDLPGDQPYSNATGIALLGNDVYISGSCYTRGGFNEACYWKNGLRVPLSSQGYSSDANGIAVKGTDIYISGYADGTLIPPYKPGTVPVYWKNGAAVLLDNKTGGLPGQILFNENDMYILDYTHDEETKTPYWKNGIKATVTYTGRFNEMAVNGKDVYVVGSLLSAKRYPRLAVYWKNDTLVYLSQLNAEAHGVAMVGR